MERARPGTFPLTGGGSPPSDTRTSVRLSGESMDPGMGAVKRRNGSPVGRTPAPRRPRKVAGLEGAGAQSAEYAFVGADPSHLTGKRRSPSSVGIGGRRRGAGSLTVAGWSKAVGGPQGDRDLVHQRSVAHEVGLHADLAVGILDPEIAYGAQLGHIGPGVPRLVGQPPGQEVTEVRRQRRSRMYYAHAQEATSRQPPV